MKARFQFILSMALFGSIGLVVRHIHLPSSEIALLRGLIGSLFLFLALIAMKQELHWALLKKNAKFIIISSCALSGNWIFLFQAFKHTTIANAVLCYYFAPVFLILLSRLVLGERISLRKAACIACALLGIGFIVNHGRAGAGGHQHLLGIASGLAAAAMYAILMVTNKFIRNLGGLETTLAQLGLTTLLLFPCVLVAGDLRPFAVASPMFLWVFVLGLVHTGIGFHLFFSGMRHLAGQTIAALSYVDPLTALVLSALILKEPLTLLQMAGGALILGSTFFSELQGGPVKWPAKLGAWFALR